MWIYSISKNKMYRITLTYNILDDPDMYENRIVGVKNGDIYLLEFEIPDSGEPKEDHIPKPTFWSQYGLYVSTAVVVVIVIIAVGYYGYRKSKRR